MKQPLTVVINTKNAEKTLERTLQSLSFADSIVVVDMASTDRTTKIARTYTQHIFSHSDVGYVEPARNFAIKKSKTDWILIVDSDEVVPPSLAKKIIEVVNHASDVTCYFIPRKNIIFGKWIEKTGWWPDFQPRLFKKDSVTWKDEVHSVPSITGSIEYFPADPELALTHYNYESISDYLERLDRYTSIAADEAVASREYSSPELINVFRHELMRRLFAEKGIEEGIHGVGLSFLQSMYELVAYLKKWESSGNTEKHVTSAQAIAVLEELKYDLSYWIAHYKTVHGSGVGKTVWRMRRKLKI